jgi:alcohol dehydrogenase class IV
VALTDLKHHTPASRTYCGEGALVHLPRDIDKAGVSRVLVVSSGSARRDASFARVTDALDNRVAAIFDGVREHTPTAIVESVTQLVCETRAEGMVAVGGGSAVVTARAVAITHGEHRPAVEIATRRLEDGSFHSPRLVAPKMPTWVVPTTPTTAYARAGAAVRDSASGRRLAMFDPATRPAGLYIDPAVASSAPTSVFAGAALNAVSMAAEGLQSSVDDPMADALLGSGLRVLLDWLPPFMESPDVAEPRMRIMLAALMAGQGSNFTGGGLAQTLAHAAGPLSAVSNGVLEATLLPHTLQYNLDGDPTALDSIADHLGLRHVSDRQPVAPEPVLRTIAEVLQHVRVPKRLRDAGIDREQLPTIVDHVLDDWFISQVPRPAGRQDIADLLQAAW